MEIIKINKWKKKTTKKKKKNKQIQEIYNQLKI